MIPFRKSLAFRILLVSFILLALPLLVDSFVIIQTSYIDAINDAKRYLAEVAGSREIPLAEMQPAKRPVLSLIEAYLNLQEDFPSEKNEDLDDKFKALSDSGGYYGIFLLKKTPEDRYLVISSSIPSYENKDYTNFIKLLNIYSPETSRLGYFSDLSFDSSTFQPYFLAGRIIFSKAREPLGIIVVTADISEKLEKLLVPETKKYPVNFALLQSNSIVFSASDPSLQFQYFAPLDSEFKELFKEEELFSKQSLPDKPIQTTSLGYPFFEFVLNGEKQVGYVKKMSTSSVSLLAYSSKDAIFTQPFIDFLDVYTFYILILLIGGIIAYFLTKRLARPMFQLGEVMQEIKKGNLSVRYQPDPLGYEINTVGIIFNEMIESLLQKQALVQQERIERETYAQELRLGQQIQRNLLAERIPEYPGVELAECYIPAKEVGGDFFDVFLKTTDEEQKLSLVIADASGKGVRACFYSLGVRSMLRAYAKEFDDVGEVMARTNALFCQDAGDTGMFITALMAFYDYRTRELSYFSCGHNPALLRRANGELSTLNHLGMAMGLEESMSVSAKKIQLEKGDLVLFYTDGITEAHDINFRMFSEERLMRFLKEEGNLHANEVAEKLLEEVQVFVGAAPQHDDITLLIMKVV